MCASADIVWAKGLFIIWDNTERFSHGVLVLWDVGRPAEVTEKDSAGQPITVT